MRLAEYTYSSNTLTAALAADMGTTEVSSRSSLVADHDFTSMSGAIRCRTVTGTTARMSGAHSGRVRLGLFSSDGGTSDGLAGMCCAMPVWTSIRMATMGITVPKVSIM